MAEEIGTVHYSYSTPFTLHVTGRPGMHVCYHKPFFQLLLTQDACKINTVLEYLNHTIKISSFGEAEALLTYPGLPQKPQSILDSRPMLDLSSLRPPHEHHLYDQDPMARGETALH